MNKLKLHLFLNEFETLVNFLYWFLSPFCPLLVSVGSATAPRALLRLTDPAASVGTSWFAGSL